MKKIIISSIIIALLIGGALGVLSYQRSDLMPFKAQDRRLEKMQNDLKLLAQVAAQAYQTAKNCQNPEAKLQNLTFEGATSSGLNWGFLLTADEKSMALQAYTISRNAYLGMGCDPRLTITSVERILPVYGSFHDDHYQYLFDRRVSSRQSGVN